MFLFKRGKGNYYICYHSKEGTKRTVSTKKKTKNEALKFLVNFEKEIEKRNTEEPPSISLDKFRLEFLRNAERTKTEKTVKAYKTTFNFLEKQFGNVNIDSISNSDIKKYLEQRFTSSSVFSARKDLINLKAAFRYAFEEHYIKSNPCIGIKQYKIPERQPLYFSKQDYEKLLKVIDDVEFKNLVMIAANTGLRQMELLTLQWTQIDLTARNIILDQHTHITKSKKIRSVPINDNICPVLLEMQKHATTDNLFSYTGRNISVLVSQKFKSYVTKAKLNPTLHFHSLRHSFASWLVQGGINIFLVSKLLGHADIKTTQIYSHLRQDDLLTSVNCIS